MQGNEEEKKTKRTQEYREQRMSTNGTMIREIKTWINV